MWILPLICFGLLVAMVQRSRADHDIRHALLTAALAWGILLVGISEALSALHALTTVSLSLCWLAATAALLALNRPYLRLLIPVLKWPGSPDALGGAMLSITAAVVLVTGLIAIVGAPNNKDSMTYHLSRVMHWAQQQSLDFYPTHILRQLHQAPFAEMVALHASLLTGSDRAFNLIQWFSMLGCLVGVSLVARQLGADSRGQLLAASLCALLPMGILQASSTQNSYVLTFWLVVLAVEALAFIGSPGLSGAVAIGSAFGLAVLTKGTALVFGPPLLLLPLSVAAMWRRLTPRLVIGCAAVAVMVALALNAGHFTRNQGLYGSVLGPGEEADGDFHARYANDELSVPIVVSNLLRNLGLQLGTGQSNIDEFTANAIRQAHEWLGIPPDDPRTSWPGTGFQLGGAKPFEDGAGNLIHVGLFALAIGILVSTTRARVSPIVVRYVLALLGGMLLFAVLLRWQPWHARLHLTGFVIATPFLALMLARLPTFAIGALLAACSVWAWPYLVDGASHPLIGPASVLTQPREGQMFASGGDLHFAYTRSATFAESIGCDQLGLMIGADDLEYPWWALLRDSPTAPRIEHVGVRNESAAIVRPSAFEPCVILARTRPVSPSMTLDGRDYTLGQPIGQVNILLPRDRPWPLDADIEVAMPSQWVTGEPQRPRVTVTASGTRPWPSRGRDATELLVSVGSADSTKPPDQEVRIPMPSDLPPGGRWRPEVELQGAVAPGKKQIRFALLHGGALHPRETVQEVAAVEPPVPRPRRGR